MKNTTVCHICGGKLNIKDLKGGVMPWKEFLYVDLEISMKVNACTNCGEVILNSIDIGNLDKGLESSIRSQTSRFLKTIKHDSNLSQKDIAKKIGFTEAYISELIGEKKTPSYQTYNLLKILANHLNVLLDLDCFKGSCDQAVGHSEELMLKEKYRFSSDDEIRKLSKGSPFKSIISENPQDGVLH